MNVFLIRHAQCAKNLSDVIGGVGAPLTELGRRQARQLGEDLLSRYPNLSIYTSATEQARETAEIAASQAGIDVTISPLLVPLHLGELAGIPSGEAAVKFAKSFTSLQAWNAGEITISALQIPGMESFPEFYRRGAEFLKQLEKQTGDAAVFSTRSVLILLANIIKGNHYLSDLYAAYKFEHCIPVELVHEIAPRTHQ